MQCLFMFNDVFSLYSHDCIRFVLALLVYTADATTFVGRAPIMAITFVKCSPSWLTIQPDSLVECFRTLGSMTPAFYSSDLPHKNPIEIDM